MFLFYIHIHEKRRKVYESQFCHEICILGRELTLSVIFSIFIDNADKETVSFPVCLSETDVLFVQPDKHVSKKQISNLSL